MPPSVVGRHMKKTYLIVNADDFGLSPAVNGGVERAHREGILTSATVLVNSPFFSEAVAIARRNPGLGVGVHLNLVRGPALSPREAAGELTDASGNMRYFRWRRMTGPFLLAAEREYRLQIEKALTAGLALTHVDFEKHHAWRPELYAAACRAAARFGVPCVRRWHEPVWLAVNRLGWPGLRRAAQAAVLRTATLFTRPIVGRRAPDYFFGQTHIGAMDEKVWLRLLDVMPQGFVEVMTHPGEGLDMPEGMGSSWLGDVQRRLELSALLSPAVRRKIEEKGIVLANFEAIVDRQK